jgi:thiamine biosynthesis protein ThiI
MRHTSQINSADILIDVRHPADAEQKPLHLPSSQIISIPFFKLEQQLDNLDKTCSYLLYCDKGIMSRIQAQLMRDKGFEQVAVYNQIT